MLITKFVKVKPAFNSSYFEGLGYILQKHKVGNHKKLMVSRNFEIDIKIEHLFRTSSYKVEYQCDNCNHMFTTSYNNYNKQNKTKGDFCRKCSLKVYNSGESNINFGKSLECGFKKGELNYASINFKGENNPNYNPNLTYEDRLRNRDLTENINWRNEVFRRDNFKCTICDNKEIEAHHLNGYTEFKESRFNINNGVTLCKNCHKSYHKTKGYKNATQEKFKEYLEEISCILFN